MKLIIQIPCYNEAATLGVTVADLPRHIDGIDEIEYLVIDDGSTDGTALRAKELGVHHIVGFPHNRGLAKGFMAGIDACLRLGADIIVNTDADNQYSGADIEKLVRPVLEGKANMVIGNRRTDGIAHFSPLKKRLQKLGSGVVRAASGTDVADTTSGFRSYSREAAMRLNVLSGYTYTLETIITAGADKNKILSVDISTNPELRESRLFKSVRSYIKRSAATIIRNYVMRRPLKTFLMIAAVFVLAALALGVRFIVLACMGDGAGHIQSLVLMAILAIVGIQMGVFGLLADAVSECRRVMDETLFHVKRIEYDNTNPNRTNYNVCSYTKEEIDKE
ncbi:MAG: glycosyltransferase family 2 protein [Oscillospiraceae bacterium]|nr:glycosyltransferase family 2 protein [Oscillospiraceae bacterium]